MCRVLKLGSLLLVLLVVGCQQDRPTSLIDVFPDQDVLSGWTRADDLLTFDRDSLFDLVNGQAESFFAYAFERVAVGRYENTEGAALDVEMWQLATPADAYGLFTSNISGSPADIGNAGDTDPQRRLAIWQDRYYVHVRGRQKLPDADLWRFGEAISGALPSGGEQPALVDRLPPDGLVDRSAIFFHQEISIQDHLWLGGENVLGLSPETDGVLARYAVGGVVSHLLLVLYPDAEAASVGLAALEGGQADNFVTARLQEAMLGAVFGEVDEAEANTMLERALGEG